MACPAATWSLAPSPRPASLPCVLAMSPTLHPSSLLPSPGPLSPPRQASGQWASLLGLVCWTWGHTALGPLPGILSMGRVCRPLPTPLGLLAQFDFFLLSPCSCPPPCTGVDSRCGCQSTLYWLASQEASCCPPPWLGGWAPALPLGMSLTARGQVSAFPAAALRGEASPGGQEGHMCPHMDPEPRLQLASPPPKAVRPHSCRSAKPGSSPLSAFCLQRSCSPHSSATTSPPSHSSCSAEQGQTRVFKGGHVCSICPVYREAPCVRYFCSH